MVFGLSGSAKKYTILFKDSNVTTELALARAMGGGFSIKERTIEDIHHI